MSQTCILISTCDAYSDAWTPFATLLFRYWPDCPWPVHQLCVDQKPVDKRIQPVWLSEDRQWASNLRDALDQLQCDSIIYLQEDYFLNRRVDTAGLAALCDFADRNGAGYVRLAGDPAPDQPHQNPYRLGLIGPVAPYRCSLQAAWWRTETLVELLIPGETGWDMELVGSRRSAQQKRAFFAVDPARPWLSYPRETGILKGRWTPGAIRQCRREGIELDLTRRAVHPAWPLWIKQIKRQAWYRQTRRLFKSEQRKAA